MHGTIAADVPPPATQDGHAAAGAQPWPSPRKAWYAMAILALALMFAELDRGVFFLLIEPIKHDFALSDLEMSFLMGPAVVIFYAVIGLPMARLVDRYPRNLVLSIGVVIWSGMTALMGVVQNYAQFIGTRVLVGGGGTVHGPGTYSMMADYFPPAKLPRAIAVLQVGFIGGMGISMLLGGAVIGFALGLPESHVAGLVIRPWQYVFLMVGLPGLVIALLIRMLHEPARRGSMANAGRRSIPVRDVLREIWRRRGVYGPLFLGLALSAAEASGIAAWRAAMVQRTYGWAPPQIGYWSGVTTLIAAPLGLLLGAWLTERLGRRHRDAPLRTSAIVFLLSTPFAIAGPLMPTAPLAIIVGSFTGLFGLAASVPQNTALQRVTPNQMRGQVTALYLFMFTVIGGGLGSPMIIMVEKLLGGEAMLRYAMALTGGVVLPLSALAFMAGWKAYAREVEALEAQGL